MHFPHFGVSFDQPADNCFDQFRPLILKGMVAVQFNGSHLSASGFQNTDGSVHVGHRRADAVSTAADKQQRQLTWNLAGQLFKPPFFQSSLQILLQIFNRSIGSGDEIKSLREDPVELFFFLFKSLRQIAGGQKTGALYLKTVGQRS